MKLWISGLLCFQTNPFHSFGRGWYIQSYSTKDSAQVFRVSCKDITWHRFWKLHYTYTTTTRTTATTTPTTTTTTTTTLHYNCDDNYNCTTPHYIQQLWWGDHCNHCNHSKKHKSNHLSIHQCALPSMHHKKTHLFEISATALRYW